MEQGSTIITHIYGSRENFRLDEKVRYDKVIARIIERPETTLWDTGKQDEFPEVEWTIVIQCVKEGK